MASDGDGSCAQHGCDMGTGSKSLIVVHQLTAKDYSLEGPLEFVQPPLTPQVAHVLTAKCLSTKRLWSGRPPKMLDRTKRKLIAALIPWLRKKQAENPHKLFQTTPAVKRYLRELANQAGLTTVSNYTLQRQIASPAFRKWKGKAPLAARRAKIERN
jgi:hypothetical protein